jgi:hypothetical protein
MRRSKPLSALEQKSLTDAIDKIIDARNDLRNALKENTESYEFCLEYVKEKNVLLLDALGDKVKELIDKDDWVCLDAGVLFDFNIEYDEITFPQSDARENFVDKKMIVFE